MLKTAWLAAGLLFGLAGALRAHEEPAPAKQTQQGDHQHDASEDHHDDDVVKLSAQQVAAGKFAVDEVRPGELGRRIRVPGSIVPSGDHIARVAVRLLGTVAELRKRLGDDVAAGEVVAVIESREVADAKSDYLAARLVFELQQTLFDRSQRLFDSKVQSENDYLRARTAFLDARVKIELARQKLLALSLTLQQIDDLPAQPVETLRRQELRAPIAGKVAERRVELGQLVGREGQENELYVIVDLATVWVDLAVPASELAELREGQAIDIAEAGGLPSPARIMFISPLLDKETRLARVVASVDNAARRWRPGGFVTAEIPLQSQGAALLVPKSALQTLEGHSVVFVRTDEGFEARKVELGRADARFVEITGGLTAGERIATANSFVLKADLGKSAVEHAH